MGTSVFGIQHDKPLTECTVQELQCLYAEATRDMTHEQESDLQRRRHAPASDKERHVCKLMDAIDEYNNKLGEKCGVLYPYSPKSLMHYSV